MSASERLRELAPASGKALDATWKNDRIYWNALPLIADVVEAAEREAPFEERGGNTGDLNRALAALQEALNGSAGENL